MTGAETIAPARRRGVTLRVFLGKLRVYSEGEPDESLVRLLRDNKQAVMDAILAAETESDRWRRALAEKVETVMTIRASQHRSDALRSLWPPRTPDATLLPIGWGERHAWLHSGCLDPWRTQRRLTAEEELARLGVVRS